MKQMGSRLMFGNIIQLARIGPRREGIPPPHTHPKKVRPDFDVFSAPGDAPPHQFGPPTPEQRGLHIK